MHFKDHIGLTVESEFVELNSMTTALIPSTEEVFDTIDYSRTAMASVVRGFFLSS